MYSTETQKNHVFFLVRKDEDRLQTWTPAQTGTYINKPGLSRKVHDYLYRDFRLYKTLQHIHYPIKASLQRLDVEYMDVLQCHRYLPV